MSVNHACTLCDWFTAEPAKNIAKARAAWHVYRDHPDTWLAAMGDQPPLNPDPDTADGYAILAATTAVN